MERLLLGSPAQTDKFFHPATFGKLFIDVLEYSRLISVRVEMGQGKIENVYISNGFFL